MSTNAASWQLQQLLSSSGSKEHNLHLPNKTQSKAKQRNPCAGLLQAQTVPGG